MGTINNEDGKMNEAVINEVIKIGAQAVVEMFANKGVTPTQEEVSAWVTKNWDVLVAGMVKGVFEAAHL